MDFEPFPKIPRLRRGFTITEKIDGTNASILVGEFEGLSHGTIAHLDNQPVGVQAASRTRLITPGKSTDNHGFAHWVYENADELASILGPGRHFGEWWGLGIQRGYGMGRKVFSLFNTSRWESLDMYVGDADLRSVPVLETGDRFDSSYADHAINELTTGGSVAAGGFMRPEGIVIYHHALNGYFKQTIDKDDEYKGKQ
jgi:hypothetical protein